ncbi:unnamed protein product [Tenebrio molitor]|nr:unnamed protein product [Tenebrio molitor]
MTESILGERVNQNLSNWIFANKNHLLYLGIARCLRSILCAAGAKDLKIKVIT